VTDPRLATVRLAVASRAPVDERERVSIARVLTELDRLPAPFDEAADPVHITGSALVVGDRGVLLVKHRRLGIWVQPGGHLDEGEWPWEAAGREAREETGLEVELTAGSVLAHVDVHDGGRGHTHLDLRYLCTAPPLDPSPPPGESQELGWFAWDEALAMTDAGLTGVLRSLRRS